MEAAVSLALIMSLSVPLSGTWVLASTLASKEDIKEMRNELKSDIMTFRNELKSDIMGVRTELKSALERHHGLRKNVQNIQSSLEKLLAAPLAQRRHRQQLFEAALYVLDIFSQIRDVALELGAQTHDVTLELVAKSHEVTLELVAQLLHVLFAGQGAGQNPGPT
jgi:hypothetical protein